MAYTKRARGPEERRSLVFDLIAEGAPGELAAEADRTAIEYLKASEEEWLNTKTDGYQGISTGYPGIDGLMGSFLPGELLTIGGDTGHGKSLLAMNIAQNVYTKTQLPVLVVNLELTRNQTVERFYSLSGDDHDYAGIIIQSQSAVAYKDIDILMKRAKEEGACLVIIDHLHFFSRSADNQTSELSRIMKHFKECAVQNELPVILLSHVTPTRVMDKNGEVKETRKPGLHNFKGSSSIEQDSDMVGFVFRDQDDTSKMEFYMRKNRSRPLKTDSSILEQTDWRLKEIWVPSSVDLA